MELNLFVEKVAQIFEESDTSKFSPSTKFKENDEWSSLLALSIIAMIDEEFGVIIKGDDIKKSFTIEDLFNIVKTEK